MRKDPVLRSVGRLLSVASRHEDGETNVIQCGGLEVHLPPDCSTLDNGTGGRQGAGKPPKPLQFALFQPADRGMNQVRGILQVQFDLDAFAVGADGFGAEIEVQGDIPGGHALAEQAENIEFPMGQAIDRGARIFGRMAQEFIENA